MAMYLSTHLLHSVDLTLPMGGLVVCCAKYLKGGGEVNRMYSNIEKLPLISFLDKNKQSNNEGRTSNVIAWQSPLTSVLYCNWLSLLGAPQKYGDVFLYALPIHSRSHALDGRASCVLC